MTATTQQQRSGAAGTVLPYLSAARIAPYLSATQSEDEALALYRWNTRMSGALHEAIGLVEVVLRNAIDFQLQAWNQNQRPARGVVYTSEWVRQPAQPLWGVLNPRQRGNGGRHSTYLTARGRAEKARDLREPSHPRHGVMVTHDDIVAHARFGTWNSLLPRRDRGGRLGPPAQRVLWEQALKHAFPHHPVPSVIKFWTERIHHLRNRVAHVEPLIAIEILGYHRTISRLLRAIDPQFGDWYAGTSPVPYVLKNRPHFGRSLSADDSTG